MHPYSRPDSASGARDVDDGGEHDDSNDYSPDSGDHGVWQAQPAGGVGEGVRHTKEKKGLIARVNSACCFFSRRGHFLLGALLLFTFLSIPGTPAKVSTLSSS